jgi:hypothetical protein
MMELDKKIREGLVRQAAAPAAQHPDPDLLTAFVEQVLTQPERQQVLQHLSLCTDCRDVVALSLPQLDAVPMAAAQPETSIWRRWLVVRWAAAAAAVVVVAGTVTLYQSNQRRQVASIVDGPAYIASQRAGASPQAEVPKNAEATPTQSKPAASSNAGESAQPVMTASAAPAEHVTAPAKKETVIPSTRSDEVMMAKAAPSPAAPPAVNAVVAAQSPEIKSPAVVATLQRPAQVQGGTLAGAGVNGSSAFPTGDGRTLRPSDDQPVQTYTQGSDTFTVADAEPRRGITFGRASETKTLARRESMGVGMFSNPPAPPIPNAPMLNHGWSVTTNGLLQRSHGVNDSHTVRVADGVFFKAVAESGMEIWAGGIGGALYHSTDDGRSWMKVMPSAGDQPLIADIVAIHASHRGAAELNTSAGDRWITVDGGQHWTKHQ